MDEPAVSVVIPAYNRADLLPETLRSVYSQTFRDFEVIVVDDGSTDGTPEMVERDFPRVRLIRQVHTGLPAAARNRGIRESRGKYIAFLDSDDLWHPEKLQIQMEYLTAHPQYRWIYSDAEAFSDAGLPRRRLVGRLFAREGMIFENLLRRNLVPQMTVVAEKICLENVGLFDEDPAIGSAEDWHMWLRLARKYPVAYVSSVLAYYRIHPGGLVRSWDVHAGAVEGVLEKIAADEGWSPGQKRRWTAHWQFNLYREAIVHAPDRRLDHLRRSLRCRLLAPQPLAFFLAEQIGGLPLARALKGVAGWLKRLWERLWD